MIYNMTILGKKSQIYKIFTFSQILGLQHEGLVRQEEASNWNQVTLNYQYRTMLLMKFQVT